LTRADDELKWLGISRLVFGGLVLLRTTPLLGFFHVPYLDGATPLLGWPSARWHIAAFGLALPSAVVAALCIARTLGVLLFTAGVWTTKAGLTASVLGYVVLAQNVMGYVNTLHLLLLGMLVLAISGAGSQLALRPEPAVDPTSGLHLVRALVVSVYAWSGLAKLNPSWLRGDALIQLHQGGIVRGALADVLLASPWGRATAAWGVAATELALGPLLLWLRTRPAAVVVALLLHAVLEASVHPDFFGFAMAALLLSFVEPRARRVTDKAPATQPPARARR
jgi:vitamin K-dependent gamma-carboxylase